MLQYSVESERKSVVNLPSFQFSSSQLESVSSEPVASPKWADWAVELGRFIFQNQQSLKNGLVVVSAPCQSSLAGVISLGYLLGEFEKKLGCKDADSYFEHLLSLPAGTEVKKVDKKGARPKVYKLLQKESRTNDQIKMWQVRGRGMRNDGGKRDEYLPRKLALNFVVVGNEEQGSAGNDSLVDSAAVPFFESMLSSIPDDQNWRTNLDSIVVAGPTGGHASPRSLFDSATLCLNDELRMPIGEVLSVREWKTTSDQSPHYCRFFNAAKSRSKEKLPQIISKSNLVVFTSVESLIRFQAKFEPQVKLCVVSRDAGDSKFELLDPFVRSYVRDAEPLDAVFGELGVQAPVGIQLLSLGRKVLKEPEF